MLFFGELIVVLLRDVVLGTNERRRASSRVHTHCTAVAVCLEQFAVHSHSRASVTLSRWGIHDALPCVARSSLCPRTHIHNQSYYARTAVAFSSWAIVPPSVLVGPTLRA